MNRTTRRGALAALAAAVTIPAMATPTMARPIVTEWHQLASWARQVAHRQRFHAQRAMTRRQLQHQVRDLAELVEELTQLLQDTHTTREPGVR